VRNDANTSPQPIVRSSTRLAPYQSYEMQTERPITWTDWYRFARDTLELSPVEAAQYATARFVEQENRARLRERPTGSPSP
jgi:hypothetical protein